VEEEVAEEVEEETFLISFSSLMRHLLHLPWCHPFLIESDPFFSCCSTANSANDVGNAVVKHVTIASPFASV